ncbi:MAG: peptide chain release factor N(5)-glutamine methyltransferase, partial [Lachnospiraceae bacterium]|nr:peptide chain release factor N(5)-glutamine methyltransferase [Lachnospiraceae bacterium]
DTLMPEVKEHEPFGALDGKEDGLYFYDKIIKECRSFLQRGGMLFFEIGYDQAADVSRMMEEVGFQEINVVQDYAGLDRVVYGTYLG